MTREQRAKQFMPFDAMKGLQKALRDREEKHTRVEKREISEEEMEANSAALNRLVRGSKVRIIYYRHFHEAERSGTVCDINCTYRFLTLDEEKIFFDDIYSICIID